MAVIDTTQSGFAIMLNDKEFSKYTNMIQNCPNCGHINKVIELSNQLNEGFATTCDHCACHYVVIPKIKVDFDYDILKKRKQKISISMFFKPKQEKQFMPMPHAC